MVNFSTPPALEGLLDLDRKGVDIRPTLLRVLTDQYLLSPAHTPEEERHYTELAMRLIDETDIPTRASVAARLAPYPVAPRSIMLQLARDMLEVAEPVLRQWPGLTPADCTAIVEERGPLYAAIIDQRGRTAEPSESPAPARALSSPRPARLPVATKNVETKRPPRAAPADVGVEAAELCELFFAAGSPERRLILLGLDCATWQPAKPPAPMQRADVWRLETAALRHNTPEVGRELERALGISQRQARRIVEDELGEPIVVAAKAMNVPADVLQRIILFMNPRVGQSVDRVYELAGLYGEISVEAACRLIAIVGAADTAVHNRQEEADWNMAAETARRALSEIATRPTVQRDTLMVQRTAGVATFGRR